MVIDTSALCAVLFGEPEATTFAAILATPDRKFLSSVNALETGLVVESRWGPIGSEKLSSLLDASSIDIVPFDASLAEVALEGWRNWGKGRHQAGLNMGDCAAYALAKVLHQPLLFKGHDFGQTDVLKTP